MKMYKSIFAEAPSTSKKINVKKILNDIPDSKDRVYLLKVSNSFVEFKISSNIRVWRAFSDRKGERLSDFEEEEFISNMKEELLTDHSVQWVRDTLKNLSIPYNEKIKEFMSKPQETRGGDYIKIVAFSLIISWK